MIRWPAADQLCRSAPEALTQETLGGFPCQ
jgi:hypothetical protein